MEFKCSGCEYKSEKKIRIKEHINKKIKCGEGILRIVYFPLEIKCEYCGHEFNTKASMRRHLTTCKIRKYNLENENKKLKSKILEIEKYKIINDIKFENEKLKTNIVKVEHNIETCVAYENFIYILREREFIKTSEHVYKIGVTKTVYNRMGDYPKGSQIIAVIPVFWNPEKLCLEKLRESFIHRKDIGSEYFEGNLKLIVEIVTRCCNTEIVT